MKKLAIIGAGVSGLILATKLQNFFDITIFEKSRGVGGRISTRYAEPYEFDHGAQFFIAKNPIFKDFVAPLLEAKVLARWDAEFVEINDNIVNSSRKWRAQYPHYVGIPKMNSIARYFAKNLNVQLNTRINNIHKKEKWSLTTEDAREFSDFDVVVCTAPPPQSIELMPACFNKMSILKDIKMMPCYSLLLGFAQKPIIPWDAAYVSGAAISWISVNSSKPARNSDFSVVVLSTNNWAEANINTEREIVIETLISETSKVTGIDFNKATHVDLQRWLYANANKRKIPTLFDEENQLGVCGDWCVKGTLEGAFLAAHNLADKIIASQGVISL